MSEKTIITNTAAETVEGAVTEPAGQDEGQQNPDTATVIEAEGSGSVKQAEVKENAGPDTEPNQEKTFTQSELDEIIKKRIERERVKVQQEVSSHPGMQLLKQRAESAGLTVEQYVEMIRKYDEQEKIRELAENNQIPESVAQKLHELENFKNQYEQEKQATEMQKKIQILIAQDVSLFEQTYPDVKPEDIPAEVWEEVDKGSRLVDAYSRYENKILRDQMAKLQEAVKVQEKNKDNASSSPGSVKGEGTPNNDFISRDTFEANKHDRRWVIRNLSAISKSRQNW